MFHLAPCSCSEDLPLSLGSAPLKGTSSKPMVVNSSSPIGDALGGPRALTPLTDVCALLRQPQFLSLLKKGFGSHCPSFISVAVIRNPSKANLGKKGFLLAHSSRILSNITGKPCWWELKTHSHITTTVKGREKGMHSGSVLNCLSLLLTQNPNPGHNVSYFQAGSSHVD